MYFLYCFHRLVLLERRRYIIFLFNGFFSFFRSLCVFLKIKKNIVLFIFFTIGSYKQAFGWYHHDGRSAEEVTRLISLCHFFCYHQKYKSRSSPWRNARVVSDVSDMSTPRRYHFVCHSQVPLDRASWSHLVPANRSKGSSLPAILVLYPTSLLFRIFMLMSRVSDRTPLTSQLYERDTRSRTLCTEIACVPQGQLAALDTEMDGVHTS